MRVAFKTLIERDNIAKFKFSERRILVSYSKQDMRHVAVVR